MFKNLMENLSELHFKKYLLMLQPLYAILSILMYLMHNTAVLCDSHIS